MSEIKSLEKLRSRILLKDIIVHGERMSHNDEAYERANGYANKLADEIEAEIAEKYMELPVDADGVPIHIGAVMENFGVPPQDAERLKVAAVGFNSFAVEEDVIWATDKCWRHYKPDQLKELLRDCVMRSMSIDRYVDGVPVLAVDGVQFDDWYSENVERLHDLMKEDGE